MDKSNKIYSLILMIMLAASIVSVVFVSYYKYVVNEDFLIYAQVECDPQEESCFVFECFQDGEDWCETGDEFWFYKVIYKKAYNAPSCDPLSKEGCPELSCDINEDFCEVIYCNQENVNLYQEAGGQCW